MSDVSFQAYLDNIEDKTGKTPREFIALAKERGYDDPATKAGVIVGAILIVTGGILLVREPGRPEHVKWIGLGHALAATIVFAVRVVCLMM